MNSPSSKRPLEPRSRRSAAPPAPLATAGLWLVRTAEGAMFPLRGAVTLGRSPECTIIVKNPLISRTHCTLRFNGQHVVLTDSSANGTFVNGSRVVAPIDLLHGDVIQFADFEEALTVINGSRITQRIEIPLKTPSVTPMRAQLPTLIPSRQTFGR